jgi:hypothetical protein
MLANGLGDQGFQQPLLICHCFEEVREHGLHRFT